MKLTENFTYEEFCLSPTAIRYGIDNNPPSNLNNDIIRTLQGLERVRAIINRPIRILSGFRSEKLNRLVGGSSVSQHMQGRAVDIISPGFGNAFLLAKVISENNKLIGFDNLILEYHSWVHVSFTAMPRGTVSTIKDSSQGYLKGLVL